MAPQVIDNLKIYHMGVSCGYASYASAVHVVNPYVPESTQWEFWRDGYELGAMLAREDEMGGAANDNWRQDILADFEEAS